MYQKSTFAKFPKKEKSKASKKKKPTTYDKRMMEIKKLNGEYNGWWIYQFCMGEFALSINNKKKRR